jgi:aspartate aminotransferase
VSAALEAGRNDFIRDVNRLLDQRLERALEIVRGMSGITCAPAEGAFYLFLNIQSALGKHCDGRAISDVGTLCELMLSKANVAVVSGDAFGDPTGIRLSYAINPEDVVEGLKRLHRFFAAIEAPARKERLS